MPVEFFSRPHSATVSSAALCLFLAFCPASGAADGGFLWKNVNIQGMGYVTGMVIHPRPPYDVYIRTDVGGAYRLDRNSATWIPLMDRLETEHVASYGVVSLALDPSDPETVWAAQNYDHAYTASDVEIYGEVMVSHDRGKSWTPTGLGPAKIFMGPNDDFRGTTGERLLADPSHPARLYFGSQKNGLWIRDGEGGWKKAAGGLPSEPGDPGVTFVLCDGRAGRTPAGFTRRIYAGVYGSGVWTSEDAGVSWTNTGGPSAPLRAALEPDGTLFVTSGGDESGRGPKGERVTGAVERYREGIWRDITPPGVRDSWSAISCDPRNPRFRGAPAAIGRLHPCSSGSTPRHLGLLARLLPTG